MTHEKHNFADKDYQACGVGIATMIHAELSPCFCTFECWQPFVPDEFKHWTRATWLAKSRREEWAPYMKLLGQRSTPVFKRSDIETWFRITFSGLYPAAVENLLASGFLPEPQKRKRRGGRKKSTPKKKINLRNAGSPE